MTYCLILEIYKPISDKRKSQFIIIVLFLMNFHPVPTAEKQTNFKISFNVKKTSDDKD